MVLTSSRKELDMRLAMLGGSLETAAAIVTEISLRAALEVSMSLVAVQKQSAMRSTSDCLTSRMNALSQSMPGADGKQNCSAIFVNALTRSVLLLPHRRSCAVR